MKKKENIKEIREEKKETERKMRKRRRKEGATEKNQFIFTLFFL